MLLYSLPSYSNLADAIASLAGLTKAELELERFESSEMRISLGGDPSGEDCVLIASLAPPDYNLLATLLSAHTLVRNGAASVTLIAPYIGYSRQDKEEPRKSQATALMGPLLSAAGAGSIITIDMHSQRGEELFPQSFRSISPAPIFAEAIRAGGMSDCAIVAPDHGAVERCEAVRSAAGLSRDVVIFSKERTASGVVSRLEGRAEGRMIIVDDIINSGETLIKACDSLLASGASEIGIMVTHGLFSGDRWKVLYDRAKLGIWVADTVPWRIPEGVRRLCCGSLLADALRKPGGG